MEQGDLPGLGVQRGIANIGFESVLVLAVYPVAVAYIFVAH